MKRIIHSNISKILINLHKTLKLLIPIIMIKRK